jgi:hypothetical protein
LHKIRIDPGPGEVVPNELVPLASRGQRLGPVSSESRVVEETGSLERLEGALTLGGCEAPFRELPVELAPGAVAVLEGAEGALERFVAHDIAVSSRR